MEDDSRKITIQIQIRGTKVLFFFVFFVLVVARFPIFN